MSRIDYITVDQILLQEIKDSELWLSREKEKSIYKRDIKKRIEEKDRYFATLDIDCFADNTRQAIRYLSELDEWQPESVFQTS